MISFRPDHLERSKEILALPIKHGRSDLSHRLRGKVPDLASAAGEAREGPAAIAGARKIPAPKNPARRRTAPDHFPLFG